MPTVSWSKGLLLPLSLCGLLLSPILAAGIGKVFHIGHGNVDGKLSWSVPFHPESAGEPRPPRQSTSCTTTWTIRSRRGTIASERPEVLAELLARLAKHPEAAAPLQ